MLEKFDVEGILAFAERVLRAPQTSGSRRRSISAAPATAVLFAEGVAFDRKWFVRTGA
jgi:hypothetical protein